MSTIPPHKLPPTPWTPWFYLRALLLGCLPMVALLTLMCGSLDAAMTLMFWSAVCTLGIGAFFWAGLAMLIGAGLQVLVGALRRDSQSMAGRHAGGLAPVGTDSDPLKPLIRYAVLGRERGLSEERLTRDLLRAGWSAAQVETAMGQACQGIASGVAAGLEGPDHGR